MGWSIVSSVAVALFLVVQAPAIAQTSLPKDKIDKLLDDILKNKEKPSASPVAPGSVPGTEVDRVRDKIRPCWTIASDPKSQLVVPVVVQMGRDGKPERAEAKDKARYGSDPAYRAAADAAVRAVMNPRCQPWPLAPEKYESWRILTLNFDSRY